MSLSGYALAHNANKSLENKNSLAAIKNFVHVRKHASLDSKY